MGNAPFKMKGPVFFNNSAAKQFDPSKDDNAMITHNGVTKKNVDWLDKMPDEKSDMETGKHYRLTDEDGNLLSNKKNTEGNIEIVDDIGGDIPIEDVKKGNIEGNNLGNLSSIESSDEEKDASNKLTYGKTYPSVDITAKRDVYVSRHLTKEEREKMRIFEYHPIHSITGQDSKMITNTTTGKSQVVNYIADQGKYDLYNSRMDILRSHNIGCKDGTLPPEQCGKENLPFGGDVKKFTRNENNELIRKQWDDARAKAKLREQESDK